MSTNHPLAVGHVEKKYHLLPIGMLKFRITKVATVIRETIDTSAQLPVSRSSGSDEVKGRLQTK